MFYVGAPAECWAGRMARSLTQPSLVRHLHAAWPLNQSTLSFPIAINRSTSLLPRDASFSHPLPSPQPGRCDSSADPPLSSPLLRRAQGSRSASWWQNPVKQDAATASWPPRRGILQRRRGKLESATPYTAPPCGMLQPAAEELQPPVQHAATRDEECYHGHAASEHNPILTAYDLFANF